MADKKAAKATTRKAAARTAPRFTAEERAALRERNRELKKSRSRAESEADLLAKIAAMTGSDREIAERLHALITATAPDLEPKTWYGMPAYARDGAVLCFFQPAQKFTARYATLGFNDQAMLDDGSMWPTSFALTALTPADEKRIVVLIERAVD